MPHKSRCWVAALCFAAVHLDDAAAAGSTAHFYRAVKRPRASPQPNIFSMLDTNVDGRISKREWSIDWHSLENRDAVFLEEDADGDGYVQWTEFSGPKGQSVDEALAAAEARREGDTNLFARLDDDGDWTITREEFLVEWHGAPESLFEAEDANEDGVISWEEFEGPKGQYGQKASQDLFSRLDTDDDGKFVCSVGRRWKQGLNRAARVLAPATDLPPSRYTLTQVC